MTTIANARHALAELKKSAAPKERLHLDTLSSAFNTIGKRLTEIENALRDQGVKLSVHKVGRD